jgi:catechol 2,3-dioxygenase-like lactoylglutathione lyase family enzyme
MRGALDHVEIYVSNLERSLEFWEWFLEKLGYAEYQRWGSGVSFILNGTYIVFVQTTAKHLDSPYHRCRTGLNHLAFVAASKSDVNEMTGELKARGMNILYQDRHPNAGGEGYYGVFFEDPDRIKVEFVAPMRP